MNQATKPKILIVDDVRANLISITQVLGGLDAELLIFQYPEEALAMLLNLKTPLALAILDVQMPGMNGYELANIMREHPKMQGVPIIFVTGVNRDAQHIHQGYASGAVDFITKPYDPVVLHAKVAVFLEHHRLRHALIAAQDEREKMLAHMANQSRLTNLGEMATGMMHEINQPLTYISSTIQTLRRARKKNLPLPDEKITEMLDTSDTQVERITKILSHLRVFGAGEKTDTAMPVSWPQVLENALLLIGNKLSADAIALITEIAPDLPVVQGNENGFEQALMQLFQNAIQALEGREGKEIRIAMRAAQTGPGLFEICFADNGCGMTPEVVDKCFEPFFTTREIGQGAGVGLSTVHGMVKKWGGTVTVRSELGKGTTVILQFPLQLPVRT